MQNGIYFHEGSRHNLPIGLNSSPGFESCIQTLVLLTLQLCLSGFCGCLESGLCCVITASFIQDVWKIKENIANFSLSTCSWISPWLCMVCKLEHDKMDDHSAPHYCEEYLVPLFNTTTTTTTPTLSSHYCEVLTNY